MIYIITPVFNRKSFTQNYLKALREQTVKEFKTIIVDDGCTDGTAEMIEAEFPEVILLKEKGDLWWTAATNIGVKYALEQDDVEYIMTLNDDTLPQKDYIEQMLIAAKKHPDALFGAFTIDAHTEKPLFGGKIMDWKKCGIYPLITEPLQEEYTGLHEVNVFPGRGLLIPKKVFSDIGFYDEKNFPQTVADDDFTLRATNFGYKIYCNYDARIKEYPAESGGVSIREEKSWKNYYLHLFGMRGAANLKWFSIFVIKNAPKKYLLSCLIIGNGRRIGGYLRDWIKESLSKKS
jgi:GT2 family glycosyltransferase